MTIIILSFVSKHKLKLLKNKLIHLFLILVAMLFSVSAYPKVNTNFTTHSVDRSCSLLLIDYQDLSS